MAQRKGNRRKTAAGTAQEKAAVKTKNRKTSVKPAPEPEAADPAVKEPAVKRGRKKSPAKPATEKETAKKPRGKASAKANQEKAPAAAVPEAKETGTKTMSPKIPADKSTRTVPAGIKTGNKGRILFLRRYLEEHTDDGHAITTEELIRLYEENGYKANRQTIADDVAVLVDSGIDVIMDHVPKYKTRTNAYHIGARLFELPELKLMVDAIASSRFITAEKSDLLISKLAQLTNAENRGDLSARLYTGDRLKTSNPNVLVTIDTVYNAIREGKKLSFRYWDHAPTGKRVLRHDGEEYIVSPYALIWDDDRYYMPSFSDKRQKIVKFRVDRMCDVKILDEDAVADPDFNAAEYCRKVIKMYDDNLPQCTVTLRCENELMKNVMDRFGESIGTEIADEKSFRAWVSVVPSSTFYGWVIQYKGGILIEGPEKVKQKYEETLNGILETQRKTSPVGRRKRGRPKKSLRVVLEDGSD